MQASKEAANWLNKNRKELLQYVRTETFTEDYRLRSYSHIQVNEEEIRLFCQDLNFYLRWIVHYLAQGLKPRDMPKGVITLALEQKIYIEAFLLIRNKKVGPNTDLSKEAHEMLLSYINRFLIKQDLKRDQISKQDMSV